MTPRLLFAAAGVETTEGAAAPIDFQTALLLVMVVCLAFMAKALADLNRRVRDLAEGRSAARSLAAPSRDRAPSPPATGVAPPPQTLAAISAAVYAAMDHRVRIVAVDEVSAEQSRTWSLEGRRQIFTSHRVR